MTKTASVPLSELAEINPKTTLERGSEYPFVPMDAVSPGRRYVLAPTSRTLRGGARFHPGDTLFARITPCLENGKIAQYDPDGQPGFGSTEFIVLRARAGRVDPGYLHALAVSELVRGPAIASMSGASGRQRANVTVVSETKVPAPSLEVQQRIAAILGAYDDLIEVNRRRVALLEEMARSIFEEWFVRFCFPGHDDLTIVETPDGPLPAGWEWGTAGDLVKFDPKTKVPKEGEKPFISMGLLDTSTSLIEPFEYRSGNSGAKFENDDTLFARITPCLENGKTGLVRHLPPEHGVGFGSTEFIVMRKDRAGPAFAYCLARNPAFREHAKTSMTGASGRQRTRTDSLAAFQMGVPRDDELLRGFEEIVWPMLQLVGELGKSNQRLTASRDLLLPRLISGQLRVAAAEHEMENAA